MSNAELVSMGASELARRIARREVSASEVAEQVIARHEEVEQHINAFQLFDAEGLRRQAKDADSALDERRAVGPLHGVPVSVKDLIDVAGLPTRYGSNITDSDPVIDDAPSVERLRKAGAMIVGKTATSEFGYKGYTESLIHGVTRNPWLLSHTPGGSSGGAGASVAAGVTPLALGTDGGGSIRTPSTFTGLVGIKGNFGRVPVWPASATPTVAHVGPMARSVDDAALLLSIIAGADKRDPFSLYPDLPPEPGVGELRGLRVAYSPTLGYARVDPEVAAVVDTAVGKLHDVFPNIELVENVCDDTSDILGTEFIGGCSARLGDAVDTFPDKLDPGLAEAVRALHHRNARDVNNILRRRIAHRERMRVFFERYDLLLTPTTPCAAWPIGHQIPPGHEESGAWSYFTHPFNLTGQPAASLPCGFNSEGLPLGLQFVVPLLEEGRLIAALRVAETVLQTELKYPFGKLAR